MSRGAARCAPVFLGAHSAAATTPTDAAAPAPAPAPVIAAATTTTTAAGRRGRAAVTPTRVARPLDGGPIMAAGRLTPLGLARPRLLGRPIGLIRPRPYVGPIALIGGIGALPHGGRRPAHRPR